MSKRNRSNMKFVKEIWKHLQHQFMKKRDRLNLEFVTKIVLTTVMPLAGGQGGTLGVQLKYVWIFVRSDFL